MTARNKIQMIIENIEKLNAPDDVLYNLEPVSRGLVVNPVMIPSHKMKVYQSNIQ